MDPYVDFWNLMAYDYAGGWDKTTGHMANIFKSSANAVSTKFDTEQAVNYYTSQGVSLDKIVLGMPLYGRSFLDTDGPGTSFNGVGTGSWEEGVWDYKVLPQTGAKEYTVPNIISSYSYDATRRMMITYDTKEVASQKANYIVDTGLGGAMWWESSGDRSGDDSLIKTVGGLCLDEQPEAYMFVQVVDVFGGVSALDLSSNQLHYPLSAYNNIRNGSAKE
jgi:chitinase